MGPGPDTTALEAAVTVWRGLAFTLAVIMFVGFVLLARQRILARSTIFAVGALAVHSLLYTGFILFWVDWGLGPRLPAEFVAFLTSTLRIHWETTAATFIWVTLVSKGRSL